MTSPTHDTNDLRSRLSRLRRSLHMKPELSGDERETAALVADRLRALGLPTETGAGGHGVVAVLETGRPGRTVAYRADMDALPLQEASTHDYASLRLGVSHACGHDVHVAVALGVAERLLAISGELRGRVVLIFQPAEESLDGARAMIEDGLLERYPVDALLALHAFPLPVGRVGIAQGLTLAGMEEFHVRFYAPSGNREALIDTAIRRLEALSTEHAPIDAAGFARVIDRMRDGDPALSRTLFISGWPAAPGSTSHTHILGLVSMPDPSMASAVHEDIRQTLAACAGRFGASFDVDVTFANPPLRNDPTLVSEISPVIEKELGAGSVEVFAAPYPFAHEDLARFAERVPTALVWLGTQNLEKGIPSVLHTAGYDVDEGALEIGTRAMLAAIRSLL